MRLKRPRQNYEAHLQFVRELPCCICGDNTSVEAAHIRAGNIYYGKRSTGMGEKPSDCWVTPLCGRHHREQHSRNEVQFWCNEGIDPWVLAMNLWALSGDHEAAESVLQRKLAKRFVIGA